MKGIEQVAPGSTFGDIGAAIQRFAEANRCSVVRDFCGHGLGRVFHAAPNVLHYGRWGTGPVLEPGMFFTIEPMINLGRPETKVLDDDWTAVTKDRSLSAQFEHSVGVTETGCEIFTLLAGRALPPDLGARGLTAGGAAAPARLVPLVLAVALFMEQLETRRSSPPRCRRSPPTSEPRRWR